MPVFWLIIVIGGTQTPMRVGNFPNLESCKKAATEMVRGSVTGTPSGTITPTAGPAPNVSYVCVQAGTETTPEMRSGRGSRR